MWLNCSLSQRHDLIKQKNNIWSYSPVSSLILIGQDVLITFLRFISMRTFRLFNFFKKSMMRK